MMELRMRRKSQPSQAAVRLGFVPPGTNVEELKDHIAENGGVYCPETGETYREFEHQFVLSPGNCYLELICDDRATDPREPTTSRGRGRKKKKAPKT